MAARLARPAAAPRPAAESWSNRRVSIRRPCGARTSTRVAAGTARARRAHIQDISLGGLALVSRERIRVGTRLLIQMKNEALGLTYDLCARVVHATQTKRDRWVLGCQFARELSVPELRTLL